MTSYCAFSQEFEEGDYNGYVCVSEQECRFQKFWGLNKRWCSRPETEPLGELAVPDLCTHPDKGDS